MADEDFDVESLARYLHLAPDQVARLADRDKLPGRRVQGAWRFSRAEIHHWLEDRIGISDDAELAKMETFLRPAGPADESAAASIGELMPPEAVEAALPARTRGSVIQSMVDVAARTGLVWDPPRMIEAVRTREELMSTALESGVALLHPRRPMPSILGGPIVALGRTEAGLFFGGRHGAATDLFFLICSYDDRGHLRTLARLSRLLSSEDLLAELRAAADAASMRDLIVRAESALE